MKKQEKKNIRIVGIFMLAMIGILMVFIVNLSEENSWFDSKIYIKAHIESADGLKTGGVVQLKGIKIGTVTDITILPNQRVELTSVISERFLEHIKQDSTVEISSKGLVGDKILIVHPGSNAAVSFTSSDILGETPSTTTTQILEKGKTITEKADALLDNLNILLNQMNKDGKIGKTMHSLEEISAQFSKYDLAKRLDRTLTEVEKIGKRINNGPGSLHSLIYDENLYNQAEDVLGGAKRSRVLKYFIRQSLEDNQENPEGQDKN